jgi:hypothetical protein
MTRRLNVHDEVYYMPLFGSRWERVTVLDYENSRVVEISRDDGVSTTLVPRERLSWSGDWDDIIPPWEEDG